MPVYMMDSKGDDNNLDWMTRQRMNDNFENFTKLFKVGWFLIGMFVGSALHDKLFHAIEQSMR